MKNGPHYSTLAARPGLIAELDADVRGSDPDLRRAAEVGFTPVEAELRGSLASGLSETADRWERLAACEAVAGARTEALLKEFQNDPTAAADLRAAARDTLDAMAERGRLGQTAGMSTAAVAGRHLQAAEGPAADTARLVSASEAPPKQPAPGQRAWWPWRRR